MEKIKFYKVTSKGRAPLEKSVDSLHHRRSHIIEDHITSTIWLIHGSGVSDTAKKKAEQIAIKLRSENEDHYKIEKPDYSNGEEVILEILENEQQFKTSKQPSKPPLKADMKKIPKVPKTNKVDNYAPVPKGDMDTQGPIIKEFQIAYYEDSQNEYVPNLANHDITFYTHLIKYMIEIQNIINDNMSKTKARKVLENLNNKIINSLFD